MLGKSTREDIMNMRRNGMKHWMTVKDFLQYQKGRYTTHKQEANLMTASVSTVYKSTPKHIHTGVAAFVYPTSAMRKSVKWVEPDNNMVWVEPQSTMIWVEPTNNP